MVLYHQRFSPVTCECVIEEQFERDETTGLNGPSSLWFFHVICERHQPLIKPKLSKSKFEKKVNAIIKHHEFLLSENRKRNLKDFDEHPIRQQQLQTARELINSGFRSHGLRMDAELQSERIRVENSLDRHEDESMFKLLSGLYSPHAFLGQDVYDKIKQEQKDFVNG